MWCGQTLSVTSLMIALTCWGVFKGMYDANIFASVLDVVPPEARGTAVGFMNMIGWLVGAGTAPVIIGYIAQRASLGYAISIASIALVAASVLLLIAILFTVGQRRRAPEPAAGIMMTLPRPIRGIIPPVLTPLVDRDTLDTAAFERLLEHLITGGASALFILGSTGEAPGLSYRLRREVDRSARAQWRAPGSRILVGITDTSYVESQTTAEYAAKSGASGLVLSPPYYYTLSQSAFLGYLERLTPVLPLPVYLYNIPGLTKLVIAPETVSAASKLPNVYGLKDSSGDRLYFKSVQGRRGRPAPVSHSSAEWRRSSPSWLPVKAPTEGSAGARIYSRSSMWTFIQPHLAVIRKPSGACKRSSWRSVPASTRSAIRDPPISGG